MTKTSFRFIHEFLPPEIEPSWRAVFDTVRERMAPVRVRTGIDFQNKTWLTTEMLVAPLGTQECITMLFMTSEDRMQPLSQRLERGRHTMRTTRRSSQIVLESWTASDKLCQAKSGRESEMLLPGTFNS